MRISTLAAALILGAPSAFGQPAADLSRVQDELSLLQRDDGPFMQRYRSAMQGMSFYVDQFDWARRAELCGLRSASWRGAAFRALQRDEANHVARIVSESGLPVPIVFSFIQGARSQAWNMSSGGDWSATCQNRNRISAAAAMIDGLYGLSGSQ